MFANQLAQSQPPFVSKCTKSFDSDSRKSPCGQDEGMQVEPGIYSQGKDWVWNQLFPYSTKAPISSSNMTPHLRHLQFACLQLWAGKCHCCRPHNWQYMLFDKFNGLLGVNTLSEDGQVNIWDIDFVCQTMKVKSVTSWWTCHCLLTCCVFKLSYIVIA